MAVDWEDIQIATHLRLPIGSLDRTYLEMYHL